MQQGQAELQEIQNRINGGAGELQQMQQRIHEASMQEEAQNQELAKARAELNSFQVPLCKNVWKNSQHYIYSFQ